MQGILRVDLDHTSDGWTAKMYLPITHAIQPPNPDDPSAPPKMVILASASGDSKELVLEAVRAEVSAVAWTAPIEQGSCTPE